VGLSNAVRKLIGQGQSWEDVWEEKEGQLVEELDRRMVAEEWLMREEALKKERRVTWRESRTFAWDFNNSITLENSHIQSILLYFDLAECYIGERTKAALLRTHSKFVA